MDEQRSRENQQAPSRGKCGASLARFRARHPKLYAARHVLAEGVGILIAALGLSALVSGLLRSWLAVFDWSWLPALPRLEPPEWLRYFDPLYWLLQVLPNWNLPDWNLPELGWTTYLIPLVIAGLVGVREVRKGRAGHRTQAPHPSRDEHGDAARGTLSSEESE